MKPRYLALLMVSAAAFTLGLTGCSGPAPSSDAAHDHSHEGHDHGDHKDDQAGGHVHGEWWCGEHGVPEEQCGQCSKEVAAALKKKGDWCEEHNRPDSQCFVCHPEYQAKFAALYEAKYGKAAPKMN